MMNITETLNPHAPPAPLAHGKPNPGTRRRLLQVTLLIVGTAILYVLSMGPALRLNQQGVLKLETFEAMYIPVAIISDGIPGAQRLIERYVNLWVTSDPSGR